MKNLVHLEVTHAFLGDQNLPVSGKQDFKVLLNSVCAKHMKYTQLPRNLSLSTVQPATPQCVSALEQQYLQFPQHVFPGPLVYIQHHKVFGGHQPFQLPGCLQDRQWSFVGELSFSATKGRLLFR